MDYSPLNPFVWLIFVVFVAITYLTVKVFHSKYPNYPHSVEKNEGQEHIVDMKAQTENSIPIENRN